MLLVPRSNYINLILPAGEVQPLFNVHKLKFKLSINLNFNSLIHLFDRDNIILNNSELISTSERKLKSIFASSLNNMARTTTRQYCLHFLRHNNFHINGLLVVRFMTRKQTIILKTSFFNLK